MKVSVIIPCYNDGHFLKSSIKSVLDSTYKNIEVIVVNDGSTDLNTIEILEKLSKDGIKVISQPNRGLGNARNNGVLASAGIYILPLDADNIITPDFITRAVTIMDKGEFDIIHTKPLFFGENFPERQFHTYSFNLADSLNRNYIDACAVYRKSVWTGVNGYDEGMPHQGNEDWEFWIHCYFKGFKFKFIEEALYGYRISENSMISQFTQEKYIDNQSYIFLKHKNNIIEEVRKGTTYKQFYANDQANFWRSAVKYLYKALKGL
jgi:glycosyltransferase involved in cell wall biosynthesis